MVTLFTDLQNEVVLILPDVAQRDVRLKLKADRLFAQMIVVVQLGGGLVEVVVAGVRLKAVAGA